MIDNLVPELRFKLGDTGCAGFGAAKTAVSFVVNRELSTISTWSTSFGIGGGIPGEAPSPTTMVVFDFTRVPGAFDASARVNRRELEQNVRWVYVSGDRRVTPGGEGR